MANRHITLTEEQHAAVEALVASGEYADASAVITEALDQLELRREIARLRQRALDAAIEEGERAYREGRYTVLRSKEDIAAFVAGLGKRT
jgi:putative addiction module CopG family antidote